MNINSEIITPTKAKKLLETNTESNRRVNQKVVSRYTSDILEGRWKEDTGELIKVSKQGKLIDGQHRLWAVIKANKPTKFHVATDVDDNVFDVLDTGKNRNHADSFKILGIKNEFMVPAIIQSYLTLKKRVNRFTRQTST